MGPPTEVLVAEDEPATLRLIEHTLSRHDYNVTAVADGRQALELIEQGQAPVLAILDWMMPYADGIEVCHRLRSLPDGDRRYILFLTARSERDDKLLAFDAGADDFLTKPFDRQELVARVRVGQRILQLQQHLTQRLLQLERAMAEIKQLKGLVPICSYCKKVRTDEDYWQQVEIYISKNSDLQFSHGICPECYDEIWKPKLQKLNPDSGQLPAGSSKSS